MSCKFLRAFCVLFILAGLSACQPKEILLPFETIEQRDSFDSRQIQRHQYPGLIVITAPEEATNLDALITPESQARLARLSYDEYFVIAVFQGRKPTTRYGVQIERIIRQENKVTVYAQLSEPKPDEEKAPVETLPYHLVQVQKVGKWGQEVTFELIVKGSIVASVSQYIP